jgi:hypothetical protein
MTPLRSETEAERAARLRREEEEREARQRADRVKRHCLLICASFFLTSCLLLAMLLQGLRGSQEIVALGPNESLVSSATFAPGIDASGTICRDMNGNIEWVKLGDQWVRP